MTESSSHVRRNMHPLLGVERRRTLRVLTFAHALQPAHLKSLDPALHFAPIFIQQIGDLLAALAAGDQQQAMQAMVVSRFVRAGDYLLDGDSHHFRISNG